MASATAKENDYEDMRKVLKVLHSTSDAIEASAVMTRDGNSLTSVLHESVDPNRLSAMCASMLSLADRAASELERGELDKLLVAASGGYLLLVQVGKNAVLTLVSKPNVNLGKVFFDAKKAANQIESML
jgi:predicted regulator of Ras-like GTPase activity (Roadblock/LC7/MglB family)